MSQTDKPVVYIDLASQVDFCAQLGRPRNIHFDGRRAVATFWRLRRDVDPDGRYCALEILPAGTVIRGFRLQLVKLPYDQHTALDHLDDAWRGEAASARRCHTLSLF